MKNGEENIPGSYMARRKCYIPKQEIERYYGRVGDADPNSFFFECDYDNEDDFNKWS